MRFRQSQLRDVMRSCVFTALTQLTKHSAASSISPNWNRSSTSKVNAIALRIASGGIQRRSLYCKWVNTTCCSNPQPRACVQTARQVASSSLQLGMRHALSSRVQPKLDFYLHVYTPLLVEKNQLRRNRKLTKYLPLDEHFAFR